MKERSDTRLKNASEGFRSKFTSQEDMQMDEYHEMLLPLPIIKRVFIS